MKKKIVIVGAGFGGVSMAKFLRNKHVDVLVLDENNYHNFQPLMYQVASGGLEHDSIAYPIRKIFRASKNIRFRMAKVDSIDADNNLLNTDIGVFTYDYLIIATGSETNFFGLSTIQNQLLALKSIPEALDIRSFLFQNLEKALQNNLEESLTEIMSVAIVGGGPAGIEMAGALAEMKKHVIPKDFPDLDLSMMHINLYQSSNKLLKTMSEESSEKSLQFLEELGVNVHLNSRVVDYKGDSLVLKDGATFKTDTVIWTAGVKGATINGLPEEVIVGGNRISVNEYNQVLGLQNVFAIGDVASCVTDENPRGLPMLAPVANQQGKHLAKNLIKKILKNEPMLNFVYTDRGSMATIGRKKAVVDLPNYSFQGSFAWFVWMFVHIMSLIGFRNKLVVFLDWFSSYLTYDKPLGLIIRKFKRG